MKELKEAKYDETITLEVFSKDRDYLKISKEKIKRMWEASLISDCGLWICAFIPVYSKSTGYAAMRSSLSSPWPSSS